MTIEKLNIKVTPKSPARSADFNRTTAKVDEIIDSLEGHKVDSNVYYGVCRNPATASYKMVDGVPNFGVDGSKPVDGCVMYVRFLSGNEADNIRLSVNTTDYVPLQHGSKPVSGKCIEENTVVCLVYEKATNLWNVASGVVVPRKIVHVDEAYTLSALLNGLYTGQGALDGLYYTLVGNEASPNFIGQQMLMLFRNSYIPVNIVDGKPDYTFEFIHDSKHFSFRLWKEDGAIRLAVEDTGTSIITVWEE